MAELADRRARWPSRLGFIFAAIGSAVGLGNVWRFPYFTAKYGGGAFLIPYLIWLFVLGIPTLLLELGVGRHFQKGDVEAFGGCFKRLRGIGVASIFSGFVIVSYYTNILSWCLIYVVGSFHKNLPWGKTWDEASDYLFNDVLRFNLENTRDAEATIISGTVFAGLLFTWIAILLCVWGGVRTVGQVVKVTMPLPILLLCILFIYNLTLKGAGDGIEAYLGDWDMDVLDRGDIWSAAAGQIFFSLSVAFGVMTAYGSFVPKNSKLWTDNLIVALSNSATSIFAGFVVYAILGNVVHEYNKDLAFGDEPITVSEFHHKAASISLAFRAYPHGLSNLGDGAAHVLGIFWFSTLWLLGIDSAFSLVEGCTTVLHDTPRFSHMRRHMLSFYICLAGFLCSTVFATDIGLALFDVVDHYVNNFGLLFVAMLESLAVSWFLGWHDTVRGIGRTGAQILTVGYHACIALGVILAWALYWPLDDELYLMVATVVPFCVYMGIVGYAYTTRERKEQTPRQWAEAWVFAGTRNIRNAINKHEGNRYLKLPILWDVLVKYTNPAILMGLLMVQATADLKKKCALDGGMGCSGEADNRGYGNQEYGAKWLDAVGVLFLAVQLLLVALFAYHPDWWDVLAEGEEAVTEEELALKAGMEELDEADGWGDAHIGAAEGVGTEQEVMKDDPATTP